jgi:excisionase family DNA binding protein
MEGVNWMGKHKLIQPEIRLLSIPQAARYLGLTPRTLYNMVAPGSKCKFPIQAIRLGRKVLFDRYDLDDLILKLKSGEKI